ncbi:MAG: site-specific integrase [Planctomycetes bacterium]|nr:site-specific integrase [Planctomycetota bacterium]
MGSLAAMKEELHQRLWSAQEKWFALRETGATKHELKIAGETRNLLFWGKTHLDYEHVLKRFVEFCHERGRERNADIDKRDMRDYLMQTIERGASASYLAKITSAIVKFGALYHKFESFRSTGRKISALVRERVAGGAIASPEHQRVTPEVAQRAMDRLRELDERFEIKTGLPRGYHLAAELQSRCGLRAFEATERMTPQRLADVDVIEKGGLERTIQIPQDLLERLREFFTTTGAACLAPLRAYESALRRAVEDVGGRATGTHARRRLWAEAFKNERYHFYLSLGMSPEKAAQEALADTLEALGHGRNRRELRRAYLRSA